MSKNKINGNRITRKYRLPPALVEKTRKHAEKWSVTETAIVQTGLELFHSEPRHGLLRVGKKDKVKA